MPKGKRRPAYVQMGITHEFTTDGPRNYERVLIQPLGIMVLSAVPPYQGARSGVNAEMIAGALGHPHVESIAARLLELHRIGKLLKLNGFFFRHPLPEPEKPEPKVTTSFQRGWDWASRFHPQWMSLFRLHGYKQVEQATLNEDRKLGFDYIDRRDDIRIAVRMSDSTSLRYGDIRIRCFSEETGMPSEAQKLLLPILNWYYFGIANSEATEIAIWNKISAPRLRESGLLQKLKPLSGKNFGVISLDALWNAGALVDTNWRKK